MLYKHAYKIPRSRSTLSSDKGHLFCHRLRGFSQIFDTDLIKTQTIFIPFSIFLLTFGRYFTTDNGKPLLWNCINYYLFNRIFYLLEISHKQQIHSGYFASCIVRTYTSNLYFLRLFSSQLG